MRGAGVSFAYGASPTAQATKSIFPGEVPTLQFVQENGLPHLKGKVALGTYIYADRPNTITGTQNCQGSFNGYAAHKTTFTINVQLKKGWNYVSVVETNDTSDVAVTETMSIFSATPSANWYSEADSGGVAVPLSLSNQTLF